MKKRTKITLIVAALLLLVGAGTLIGVLAANGWNFKAFSTVKYTDAAHEVTEEFHSISLTTNTADIYGLPTEEGTARVVCHEEEKLRHEVKVENGTLTVAVVDTHAWYDHIGIFGFENASVTVYLPKDSYTALAVVGSTGDVEVSGGIGYGSVSVEVDTGDVTCRALVEGALHVKASTGDVLLESLTAGSVAVETDTGDITLSALAVAGECKLTVTTGDTLLRDVSCRALSTTGDTGDLELIEVLVTEALTAVRSSGEVELVRTKAATMTVTTDTGDVELDATDADEMKITTDTGDVSGSLGSEKMFIVHTDTGSVDVPATVAGGKCEITTDTGDIRMTIKQ